MSGAHAIGDVPPVIWSDIAGVDVGALHCIDVAEYLLDFRPGFDLQEDVAAGTHERQRLIGFARLDGAHDVDAREDGAEVVGSPTDEGEDAARTEGKNTPAAVENFFVRLAAEPDPVLDPLLNPGQFDMG